MYEKTIYAYTCCTACPELAIFTDRPSIESCIIFYQFVKCYDTHLKEKFKFVSLSLIRKRSLRVFFFIYITTSIFDYKLR